jgi:hypothetical protein
MHRSSETIGAIAAALAKAQGRAHQPREVPLGDPPIAIPPQRLKRNPRPKARFLLHKGWLTPKSLDLQGIFSSRQVTLYIAVKVCRCLPPTSTDLSHATRVNILFRRANWSPIPPTAQGHPFSQLPYMDGQRCRDHGV